MKDRFKEELELLDLDNKLTTASYIKQWVEKQTDGQITDLFTDISPLSTAALVSTEN